MCPPRERTLTILLAILVALATMSLTGCKSTDNETATASSGSAGSAAVDATATTGAGAVATTADSTQTTSGTSSAGAALTGAEREDAVDIAQAYFVAKTDFTSDQFAWKLEAAAQDNEGGWWVRVSATPKDDPALDIVQVYVKRPAGRELWVAHDMGTGIDPATDESFPPEVRDQL